MNTAPRPRLSLWALWNLSFALFGMQLGAAPLLLIFALPPGGTPYLLALPVLGLLLQPLVGSLTDGAWGGLGRRRPLILCGGIAAAFGLSLFFQTRSPTLSLVGLGLLCAALHVSIVQLRAMMAETAPLAQQTSGYMLQGLCIAAGTAVAFLPVTHGGVHRVVMFSVVGTLVVVFTTAWTVLLARERPPETLEEIAHSKTAAAKWRLRPTFLAGGAFAGVSLALAWAGFSRVEVTVSLALIGAATGVLAGLVFSKRELTTAAQEMPLTMKQLATVQALTWVGLSCCFLFIGGAMHQQILGGLDRALEAGRIESEVEEILAMTAAGAIGAVFVLMIACRLITRRMAHSLALLAGGAFLLASGYVTDPLLWKWLMTGVGAAWISSLLIPYAILAGVIRSGRAGAYMGLFHCSIAAAQLAVLCVLGPMINTTFPDDPVKGMMIGGALLLAAAVMTQFVGEGPVITPIGQTVAEEEGLLSKTPPQAPAA